MTIDFGKLRSNKGNNLKQLQQKLEQTEGSSQRDPRVWKPTRNSENKSENIIRFLPIPFVDMQGVEEGRLQEEDLTPMAKVVSHYFEGAKGWYIENSLQTFGEKCPVRDYCTPLWKKAKDTNDEVLKNKLRPQLPSETYYANVLIIKDGTNPANNGKVMLYEFGSTVRKLLEKAGAPEFEDEKAFDPFDMWEGANLRLNLAYEKKKFGKREAMVPNFDGVKWGPVSALAEGDETEMERLWKAEHSIMGFYDRKNFKSYDELQAKYFQVMGLDSNGNVKGDGASLGKTAEEYVQESTPSAPAQEAPAADEKASAPSAPAKESSSSADDDLEQFEKMLRGE